MRRTALVPSALFLLAVTSIALAGSPVRVRGHFRRDGTYVQPHVRTAPDRSFSNNWSTRGNVNPYTGEPGTKDYPSYSHSASSFPDLRRYYGSIPSSSAGLSVSAQPALRPSVPAPPKSWTPPDAIAALPPLPDDVAPEELQRSQAYCSWLYDGQSVRAASCMQSQVAVLARISLPDYSETSRDDLSRSSSYCEWLYGDNRAGFYNCINAQILGLARSDLDTSGVDQRELQRARAYCEWLYGDNRSGFHTCLRGQTTGLRNAAGIEPPAHAPSSEWTRSLRYCEWLYGDNRAGFYGCARSQARGLRSFSEASIQNAPQAKRARCEWLYGDNRGSFWPCVAR